jgi:glycopeptide antibiotics resistance protein
MDEGESLVSLPNPDAYPDGLGGQVARLMQLLLVVAFGIGVLNGSVPVMINAAGGFLITLVPAMLERDSRVSMDVRLSVWITLAVFLHVVGALGLPGIEGTLYSSTWWWDHVTHATSASLVVAIGYSLLRSVDEHVESVDLPPELTFVFTFLLVLAVGVYWEVLEFALSFVTISGERALTQYGVGDTLGDLAFDTLGGLFAALIAQVWHVRVLSAD